MLLVEKNWQSVKNAQQNYIALNTNIELASEMLRFRRLGFQEGVNTAVEVMQAEYQFAKGKNRTSKSCQRLRASTGGSDAKLWHTAGV